MNKFIFFKKQLDDLGFGWIDWFKIMQNETVFILNLDWTKCTSYIVPKLWYVKISNFKSFLLIQRTLSIVPFCGDIFGFLGEVLEKTNWICFSAPNTDTTPNCHSAFRKAWLHDLRNGTMLRYICMSLTVLDTIWIGSCICQLQ